MTGDRSHVGTVPRAAVALAVGLSLGLAGCTAATSPSPSAGSSLTSPSATVPSIASTPTTPTPAAGSSAADAGRPFGPGCSRILGSDSSSLEQLSASQVADAVAKSPVLSRLRAALEQAGLVEVLNSTDDITVFAPDDDAFSRLGRADAARLLTDRSLLVTVLKTHVVQGRLGPDQLPGSHQALSGETVVVTGSGDELTVNGDAKVVCGNIQTSNGTLYVIDRVLMPR